MPITNITSISQLDAILSESDDKLSIIDFHAEWCGPCHMIAPVYETLSNTYANANFLKCDVDAAPDVSARYNITAMPTFVFLKNGEQIELIRGSNKLALQSAVERHAGAAAAFPGQGHTLMSNSSSVRRSDGILSDIYAYYSGLDPQVKVLMWVLVAYFGFMKLA